MAQQIGVITEQGDLGLGFNPISSKDQKTIHEHSSSQSNKNAENGEKEKK